jgi:E3 ubiquitin-protein ligase RNF14
MAAQARALESQVWRERDEERDDDKASTADDRRAQEEEMSILVSIFCDCARGDDANAVREALASGRDVGDATSSGRLFRAELEIDVEIDGEAEVLNGDSTHRVAALPPIFLEFIFPRRYPSREAPKFVIRSDWLSNSHLSAMCARLDAIWEDQRPNGEPIVYEWTQWIKNDAMRDVLLNAQGALDVSARGLGWADGEFEVDARAVVTARDANEAVFTILRADAHARRRAFLISCDNSCSMCLADDIKGVDVRRVSSACAHTYCVECVTRMARVHVSEGSVLRLVCPECSCAFDPHVLRAILNHDEYEKYEATLLARTLDSMADLVYCPRCEHPVIEEEDQNFGRCPGCFFAFCTLCRASWHAGSECLNAEQKLAVLEARRRGDSKMSEEALRQYKEQIADASAAAYVERNGRKCPVCGQGVEKNEGCNKMTCACGAYFCWKCGQKLEGDGYSHYRNVNGEPGTSTCQLFDLDAIEAWERDMAALRVDGRAPRAPRAPRAADVISCIRCKAQNVAFDRNNHVRCWACNSSFCAACRRVVLKTSEHYAPSAPCKQHRK